MAGSAMALTIRLDLELVLRLHAICRERKLSMRAVIVDLLRERFGLPALSHKPARSIGLAAACAGYLRSLPKG